MVLSFPACVNRDIVGAGLGQGLLNVIISKVEKEGRKKIEINLWAGAESVGVID